MSSTVFTPLTTALSWVDATTNVDGSAIQPGEITGYSIGVRGDGTGAPGTYALTVTVTGATATSDTAADIINTLKLTPGNYWGSVQSVGPTNSAWATEVPFAVPAPLPVPNPPTGLSVS